MLSPAVRGRPRRAVRVAILILAAWLGPLWPALADSLREECRVRVENRAGGDISVSVDAGSTWSPIGKVMHPNEGVTLETTDGGFTAADWASDGAVAATAANAIHIKVHQGQRHAVLFSLQPREFLGSSEEAAKSYFSSPSSIFTDIPAGTSLFGSAHAPRLGNPVYLGRSNPLVPLPADYRPSIGDVLVLVSVRPVSELRELHVFNREGGLVTAAYRDGSVKVVGRVERAVGGTGRFAGTLFADIGQIRANHPGVVCVSTSPLGQIGGFQIVPSRHAREPNLSYVWGAIAAWMVVGPLLPGQPALEGAGPLFGGHLRPGTGSCQVRRGAGAPWAPLPTLVGLSRDGLSGVTELRLRF